MHHNEESLFAKVLEITDPQQRASFLQQECAGDEELRQRIERLLAAHATPDSFYDSPVSLGLDATRDFRNDLPQEGEVIGPYKLLQRIGEGGMGTVYMAEQTRPVRRRVALKIVKLGMDSRRVIARFEAERQALAMMDHPNIARVYDAGTTDSGRPYFAMELVNGLPITEYCDQHKLNAGERLRLFACVCRAVHHAHQKGIIHRDLKPSNILIAQYDNDAVAKVIDFGIAKATGGQLTEKTLFTEFGQIIGTLEYMSPEQAKRNQLDVDTRSDIYSLGVLLYALLTGETPHGGEKFADAAWDEVLRLIREEEPPRPSDRLSGSNQIDDVAVRRNTEPKRLTSLIRGDLDWIVMKALEKDRSDRYPSANDFAADIERYLNNQPIVARPASWGVTTRKWLARHRPQVAIVIAVALCAAVVGGSWWRGNAIQTRNGQRLSQQLAEDVVSAESALGAAIVSPIGRDAEWLVAEDWHQRIQDQITSDWVADATNDLARSYLQRYATKQAERKVAEEIEEVLVTMATSYDLESWSAMEIRMREIFLKNGFDVANDDPMHIAEQIRAHPMADTWSDLLELWIASRADISGMGGPAATAANMQPWAEAIYVADTEPVRTAIRRFIYEQKRDRQFIDEAIEGVDLKTLSARTLSWLASVYAVAGAEDEMERIFEVALQVHHDDLMLNHDYATMLTRAGRWNEATRIYHRCLTIRPDVAAIWKSLSVALEKNGESENAKVAMLRSQELIDP